MSSTLHPGPGARKSVLICPDCGHESPPGGDWRRFRVDTAVAYACPDCGSTITHRPPEEDAERGLCA